VAAGKVVKSLNGRTGTVTLSAGSNVTITPLGNNLLISAPGAGTDDDWVVDGSDMYADVSNHVGIGTTNPAAKLHIGSGGNTELRLDWDDYQGMISFYGSLNGSTRDAYIVKDNDAGKLGLSANGSTDHITILDDSGNVGIGTDSPEATLDIAAPDGGTLLIRDGDGNKRIEMTRSLFDLFSAADPDNYTLRMSGMNGNESNAWLRVRSLTGGSMSFIGDDLGKPTIAMLMESTGGAYYAWWSGNLFTLRNDAGSETIRFDGATGSKSAVVATRDHGQRLLYCLESPELWFEDFGSGRSDATFDWRVVAKKSGREDVRLEVAEPVPAADAR